MTLLAQREESDFLSEESDFLSVIDFSPEGDRILFSREKDGVGSLWTVNADASDACRLIAGTAWGDWLSPGLTP